MNTGYQSLQQHADAEYRVANRSSLRCWAGVNCCIAVLYIAGCLFLLYYVHWQLDFVFSPGRGLQMDEVNYYNCNATLEASTAADYMSGASWALYGEDILRLLVVFAVLGYAWLAPLCSWYTSAPIIFLLLIFGLYDIGKAIYLTLISTNSITPACQEYPFCTSHDFCVPGTQLSPGSPDVTFTAELAAAWAFGIVELLWTCIVYRVIPKKRRSTALEIMNPGIEGEPIAARVGSDDDDDDDELDRPASAIDPSRRSARKRTTLAKFQHQIPQMGALSNAETE